MKITSDAKECRDIVFPSEKSSPEGRLRLYQPLPGFLVFIIDIYTQEIPYMPDAGRSACLKINLCTKGRCELKTHRGECTYLIGNEIAADTGQTLDVWHYPTHDYHGIEIVIYPKLLAACQGYGNIPAFTAYRSLIDKMEGRDRPWILPVSEEMYAAAEGIRKYGEWGNGSGLILMKALELILLFDYACQREKPSVRTYYPSSCIEIAKKVKDTIAEDLSSRHTAAEFAARFGLSETSIKNYFKSVYGIGYKEFQKKLRMVKAAQLILSGKKIAEAALLVGFATQSKFTAAFKAEYGMTPLEYKRKKGEISQREKGGSQDEGNNLR